MVQGMHQDLVVLEQVEIMQVDQVVDTLVEVEDLEIITLVAVADLTLLIYLM